MFGELGWLCACCDVALDNGEAQGTLCPSMMLSPSASAVMRSLLSNMAVCHCSAGDEVGVLGEMVRLV